MSDPRLASQIAFLLEADRLKGVERRNHVLQGERRENSAEHSWHLAMFALVLAEHAGEPVDLSKVIVMLLLHDLVEIDAGDTFIYDEVNKRTQEAREAQAADRLFGLLPDDQGRDLRAIWDEFELAESSEARFAKACDRLQPLLLNHASQGITWLEHGVTVADVARINGRIEHGSPVLWSYAQTVVADIATQGFAHPG